MSEDDLETTERIARLNDAFRANPGTSGIPGSVIMTRSIAERPEEDQTLIFTQVRLYSDFNEDCDPYGEHDFGVFYLNGEKFFWKIDYYDLSCEYGSNDPADPSQTHRVLTIMLAEEY